MFFLRGCQPIAKRHKAYPDEKGTESSPGHRRTAQDKQCHKAYPDEKGTESPPLIRCPGNVDAVTRHIPMRRELKEYQLL